MSKERTIEIYESIERKRDIAFNKHFLLFPHCFHHINKLSTIFARSKIILSLNIPCFQCNIAITNFLVLYTCEIRFHDVSDQSTVPMYSYAKILKHG